MANLEMLAQDLADYRLQDAPGKAVKKVRDYDPVQRLINAFKSDGKEEVGPSKDLKTPKLIPKAPLYDGFEAGKAQVAAREAKKLQDAEDLERWRDPANADKDILAMIEARKAKVGGKPGGDAVGSLKRLPSNDVASMNPSDLSHQIDDKPKSGLPEDEKNAFADLYKAIEGSGGLDVKAIAKWSDGYTGANLADAVDGVLSPEEIKLKLAQTKKAEADATADANNREWDQDYKEDTAARIADYREKSLKNRGRGGAAGKPAKPYVPTTLGNNRTVGAILKSPEHQKFLQNSGRDSNEVTAELVKNINNLNQAEIAKHGKVTTDESTQAASAYRALKSKYQGSSKTGSNKEDAPFMSGLVDKLFK